MAEPTCYPIRVDEELQGLGLALEAFRLVREKRRSQLGERAPVVSAWSLEQHLYHIALATDLALGNVSGLANGKSALIVHEGQPNTLAQQVLRDGHYPRGESEAPRMVRPPDEVEGPYLDAEMERNRKALEAMHELSNRIPKAKDRIPHQALGPLNASEWLRFARLHAEHHLAILHDIERSLG